MFVAMLFFVFQQRLNYPRPLILIISGPSLSALLGSFPTHPRCIDHSCFNPNLEVLPRKFSVSLTQENKEKLFELKLLDFICSKWVKTK